MAAVPPPPAAAPCHLTDQLLVAGIPGGMVVNNTCMTCGHAVGHHQHAPGPVAPAAAPVANANDYGLLVDLVCYLWSAFSSSSASMRSTLAPPAAITAPRATKTKTARQRRRASSNRCSGSSYGEPGTSYERAKDQKEESEPLLRRRQTVKTTQSDAKT